MTEHDALLWAILDHPKEIDRRFVYADWCEDNGLYARAELIRLDYPNTFKKSIDGITYHEGGGLHSDVLCECYRLLDEFKASLLFDPGSTFIFRNGFIDEVHCTLEHWNRSCLDIMKGHPVNVVLTERYPARTELDQTWWYCNRISIIPSSDHHLPSHVWKLMRELFPDLPFYHNAIHFTKGTSTDQIQAAIDALSETLVKLGKNRVRNPARVLR